MDVYFKQFANQCIEIAALIGREIKTDFVFTQIFREQTLAGMSDFNYRVNCIFYPETDDFPPSYFVAIYSLDGKTVFESGFLV